MLPENDEFSSHSHHRHLTSTKNDRLSLHKIHHSKQAPEEQNQVRESFIRQRLETEQKIANIVKRQMGLEVQYTDYLSNEEDYEAKKREFLKSDAHKQNFSCKLLS